MIELRPIQDGDVEHVAANIRPMDRRECEELFDVEPLQGLRDSVANSPWCAAVVSRGVLICLVGVGRHDDSLLCVKGKPWLIGIDGIERHSRAFAVLTKPVIERMEAQCPLLENIVHSENEMSVRWLRRSGFTLEAPEPSGRQGVSLIRFHKVRAGWLSSRQ